MTLSKANQDFLVSWFKHLELTKNTRSSYNLKQVVEGLFFYISGEEMHQILKATGLEGNRWSHNVSQKQLDELLIKYPWRSDFMIRQVLSNDSKYRSIVRKSLSQETDAVWVGNDDQEPVINLYVKDVKNNG